MPESDQNDLLRPVLLVMCCLWNPGNLSTSKLKIEPLERNNKRGKFFSLSTYDLNMLLWHVYPNSINRGHHTFLAIICNCGQFFSYQCKISSRNYWRPFWNGSVAWRKYHCGTLVKLFSFFGMEPAIGTFLLSGE